jgi:hypothetical protein
MTGLLFNEGEILFVRFEAFAVRLTFGSGASLGIAVIAGENEGVEDTVAYKALAIGPDVIVLSWQETIGSKPAPVRGHG